MEPDKTGTATDRNRVDWPERRWRWCRRPAVCNSTAKSDAAVLILRVNGYARGARARGTWPSLVPDIVRRRCFNLNNQAYFHWLLVRGVRLSKTSRHFSRALCGKIAEREITVTRLQAPSDNPPLSDKARASRPAIKTAWAVLSAVAMFGWVVAIIWGAAWIAQHLFT